MAEGCVIGQRCIVHSGAVIGADGFGFALHKGTWVKIEQLGGVRIGDDVEIGANCAIDRAVFKSTIIEDGVRLDNLVHIAHNVIIHDGAFVIACAEVSGSVEIGKNAWIAPNACINQKLKIGDSALVGLGAVVTKNVENDSIVAGNPAKKLVKR